MRYVHTSTFFIKSEQNVCVHSIKIKMWYKYACGTLHHCFYTIHCFLRYSIVSISRLSLIGFIAETFPDFSAKKDGSIANCNRKVIQLFVKWTIVKCKYESIIILYALDIITLIFLKICEMSHLVEDRRWTGPLTETVHL